MKKLLCALILLPLLSMAQQQREVGGMTVSWTYNENYINFKLNAPNDGWVALGFNNRNDIKDTHLLMFATKDGKPSYQELYVKAAGNPV
ncbi:MAG: DOMON domain-containing protein, partial [Bacteroidota bacterium]